jgi:hypothetical protein
MFNNKKTLGLIFKKAVEIAVNKICILYSVGFSFRIQKRRNTIQ